MDEQQRQEIPQEIPRQKTLVFKIMVGFGAVLVICIIAAGIAYVTLSARIETPLSQTSVPERIFVVEKGDNAKTIATRLEQERFIADSFLFEFYAWDENIASSLQAGKYLLSASLSPKGIADKIARGDVARDTIVVTIPEGYGIWTIEAKLREIGLLAKEKRHLANLSIGEFSAQHDFFADAPAEANLDGYLFPDTYEFEREATLDEIVGRMLDNFGRKLDAPLREEIRRQEKSISDIVIMASMIQKEVITPEDMRLVSGLLWKRIAIGMPLQVDATVSYALNKNDLTRADLATDTPYNTYLYKGLPKGPIGNPGKEALLAAIYPTENDYLFYISKPNKETVFSRTLQEHNAAVAKYLR
ncbi:MAG: endolytic transglycosylase MltG [Candidatus Azambacteria bacterium]|nr:endolytic transglycosylase MltG [Candidatus Azambacteria bacterium]